MMNSGYLKTAVAEHSSLLCLSLWRPMVPFPWLISFSSDHWPRKAVVGLFHRLGAF
jgi:hypothetical protein